MSEKSVLIVEDAVVICEHLKMLVENQGYQVVGVTDNGREAVELAASELPDLILMDIKLIGDIDGIETVKQIKEEHGDRIGVVYITAYGDEVTLKKARKSGAKALFTKPVRKEALDWILRWYFHGEQDLTSTPSSLQAWFFNSE